MNVKPLFIIGCPRSGTTFFASLLELTDYGRPFETHFIPKYYKRLDRYGDLRIKNNARRLLRDILAERPVQQWKLNVDVDAFLCERGNMSYAELAREVCTLHARQKGKSTWGDKTPRYNAICRLFMRFIRMRSTSTCTATVETLPCLFCANPGDQTMFGVVHRSGPDTTRTPAGE